MNQAYLNFLSTVLRTHGVQTLPGLLDKEIEAVEAEFGFRFPPDLRAVLQHALPVGDRFPNWRGPKEALLERLTWPREGICFDVERNNHWESIWGPKPANMAEAVKVAQSHIDQRPPLIPVYSHRYLPSVPCEAGNPVLSFYQTDVIYYGFNLMHYFGKEFGVIPLAKLPTHPKPIPYWDIYLGDDE